MKKEHKTAVTIGVGLAALFIVRDIFADKTDPAVESLVVDLENLSYSEDYYGVIADSIFNAIYGDMWLSQWFELDEIMATELMKMNTLDDVKFLVKVYGSRAPLLEADKTLYVAVRDYLDSDYLQMVNNDYVEKGINWLW
jgi:hypothetical protein